MPKKTLKRKQKESAKFDAPKELLDMMTKEPKLIEPTKAINDSSFLIETFPRMLMQGYQELIKDLVPIMKKYGLMKIEASMFKKWKNDEETDMGVAQIS